ncbi:MAG: nuclear transport factor 2 family protein [Alphaproteobacteria bacterium]|nr:nuclear transport factor 2 family protein [Alphaproteobacteria bacterium]
MTYDEAFVARFLAPWNAHDIEGAMALMADDCLWEVARGPQPHGAAFHGAAAVRGAMAAVFAALPDIRYELVRASFGPDLIVLELSVSATSADGPVMTFHACDVMTMRDGKVAAKRSYRKVIE